MGQNVHNPEKRKKDYFGINRLFILWLNILSVQYVENVDQSLFHINIIILLNHIFVLFKKIIMYVNAYEHVPLMISQLTVNSARIRLKIKKGT